MRQTASSRLTACAVVALSAIPGSVSIRESLVLAQAPSTAAEGGLDPALFRGLRWRSIGPARGGRSQAVAGSSSRPLEYYFGATGGGLWKTTDGGVTWQAVSDRFFKTSSVGAVAIAESNPDVVYVGMGETQLRGNVIQGDGVYKTTDAGKTWTHLGLETHAGHRAHPNASNQSRHRLRRRARESVHGDADRGSLQDAPTAARRGTRRSSGTTRPARLISRCDPTNPGRPLRWAVGSLPHAAFALQRRAGQRPLQVDRRRRELDRADEKPGTAKTSLGQGRRVGVRR